MPAAFSFNFRRWIFAFGALISSTGVLLAAPAPVSFRNDVMAVLAKSGCNAGACHGNQNGKAGFKLSLRGEDPHYDFESLSRDQGGRRLDPLSPDDSLILLKATGQIAHEGGQRFARNSREYGILRDWIAAGARPDPENTPKLLKLTVTPQEKIFTAPARSVQFGVTAEFSDGTRRDLHDLAVYEPGNALVKVSSTGLVEGQGLGEAVVLVRYLNQQVPVRLAFIPNRPKFKWNNAKPFNFIDEQVFAKLRTLTINPSELCTDAEFARRAYFDLLGIPPTAAEARAFVSDRQPDKRARLVDTLLERPEYAEFWASKWADLLRVEEKALDRKGVEDFYQWIRRQIASNVPLDEFARDLITARGSTYANPAANYYRVNRDPVTRSVSAAQVFLGVRLQCAQCHNHPYEHWTQDDYYDWASVFARIDYKIIENKRRDKNDEHEFNGEQIVYLTSKGSVNHPRTGKPAPARLLGAPQIDPDAGGDRLDTLANWLTSPDNKSFARTQANRIWYHLMGRGIVDPVDDFRDTNLPSHPALLDRLAQELVQSHFDLRHMIRLIMASSTYQTSNTPNDTNPDDETNYSRNIIRRFSAEQLLDAQSLFTGVPVNFDGRPSGTRASQLPGVEVLRNRYRSGAVNQFLTTFGKPPRVLPSECERSCDTTMGQAFQLISGPNVQELISPPENILGKLLKSGKSQKDIVDELYWASLSRPPSKSELDGALKHIAANPSPRPGLEDLAWALINSKEFIFRK